MSVIEALNENETPQDEEAPMSVIKLANANQPPQGEEAAHVRH